MTMKKKSNKFKLSRIEVVTKAYDSQSRIVKEKWEYYYPTDASEQFPSAIGFKVDEDLSS